MRARTFRSRILIAMLAVVLVPAALTAIGATLVLRDIGVRSGTLGAWDAVAESGRELLGSLDSAGVQDPAVRAAAERHRVALSESVRFSRLYAFMAERFVAVIPVAALVVGLLVAALAYVVARGLARSFAGPVTELVGWTERIAREEPLPPEAQHGTDVLEFGRLRAALRSMAAEIALGRARAVEAARLRSWTEFARRVAHEIKNPLTSMRMAAATLDRQAEGPRAEAASVLIEDIDRLDDMARSFAQLGRVPEGPRSDVDLVELLEGLERRERAGPVPVRVQAEGRPVVHAHLEALAGAFRNLLLNAIEAQSGAGGASVDILVEARAADAVVEIADRGPGIPEELLDEIWNPDVTTKRRGTGLGLAIVRRTVELHGGSVAATNRDGGGASFRVVLPYRFEPPSTS